MRRANQLLLVLALASVTACGDATGTPTLAGPVGAPPATATTSTDIAVTTTIYDADAIGNPLLMQSDDFNGSGFATYSPIGGVHNSLTSHVTATGAWQLYIGNQTTRTVHLLLADAGLPFANGYYWSSVEMASRCSDQSGTQVSVRALAVGASYDNCSLIVDFDIGTRQKTTYKLAMGPNFAGTGRATVTCNATDGTYCTSWTIVPNDAAPNARVAILTGGNGTTSLDGKFYTNSYSVTDRKSTRLNSSHD